MKVTVIPNVSGALGMVPSGLVTSGDHADYSITEIGQNTDKSPGDLRRLSITQIPVENH